MLRHGTPSTNKDEDIGDYIQFQTAVLRQLPRPHQMPTELRKSWLDRQHRLRLVLLKVLVEEAKVTPPDIDTPVEAVFTFDLCTNQLGYSAGVRTRILNACANNEEAENGEWVSSPIRTLRDVIEYGRSSWERTPNIAKVGVRLIESVLHFYGFDWGMQLPQKPD